MNASDAPGSQDPAKVAFIKAAWRLIPLLFLCYIVAFLDRVNVGFAKLQMAGDLKLSDAVYGFGAGAFFFGYFLFEVPSNLILGKVGARRWIARIMITWGLVSAAFMFTQAVHWGGIARNLHLTDAELTFYVLRFLLGVAEAGFFPGIVFYLAQWFPGSWQARMGAGFMSAIAISNVIGGPISGAILQFFDGALGLHGWQWLFLIEALPALLIGLVVLAVLPDGPKTARWLSAAERDLILSRLGTDESAKTAAGHRRNLFGAFADARLWALATVYFCGNLCFYAVNFWMPTLIQELGIDRADYLRVGLLSMIPWGVAAVAQILWAMHSDHTGERRWHAALGLLLTMIGLLGLAFVQHAPALSIAALTCVTAGILCYISIFWTLPAAFLSGAAAAAGIAWINSVGNLGGFFGPDLIGRIRTATGGSSQAAFLALAAAALLGAMIILVLPMARRPSR